MFQNTLPTTSLPLTPQSLEVHVEPFPEAKSGAGSQSGASVQELEVSSPIPSPKEIVEKVLATMSDFPEDEEKDSPSPDRPTKGKRFLRFFSS